MAIDVAQLSVQVDTTDLQDGTAALNKFAATGATTEKRVTASMGKVSRSFDTVGKSAGAMGAGGLRNVSLQLSQVAQQGAATGNYLQALAIQLPDMAIGFGTIGIAAGVAAGALLPLIANMMGTIDQAEGMKGALEAIDEIAAGLEESLDILTMTSADLSKAFGDNALRVREFAAAQAQFRVNAANESLREQITLLDGVLEGFTGAIGYGQYYELMLKKVAAEFKTSADGAVQLESALRTLRDAPDYPSQVAALQELVRLMDDLGIAAENIPPELSDALDNTITLSREMDAAQVAANAVAEAAATADGAISGAASSAAVLAQNLQAAAAQFSRIRSQESKEYSGRGGDPRQFMQGGSQSGYTSEAGYTSVTDLITKLTPKAGGGGRKGSSGGGGGVDPLLAEAERLFKDTRTAAEEYAAELERVNMLHDKGYITAETYTRAIDMIDEKYQEAIGAGKEFEELQTMLKDAVLDFAENGVDSLDDLAAAIRRAALEALLFGQGPLGGILGGAGGKGLIGGLLSFDGGGFTGYGARTGGLDGKGGFLAMMHPNETVSDHTKGQGGSGVHVTVSMDNNGNLQAYVDRVASSKTAAGLKQYDRAVAPRTISRQRRDPRRIG